MLRLSLTTEHLDAIEGAALGNLLASPSAAQPADPASARGAADGLMQDLGDAMQVRGNSVIIGAKLPRICDCTACTARPLFARQSSRDRTELVQPAIQTECAHVNQLRPATGPADKSLERVSVNGNLAGRRSG